MDLSAAFRRVAALAVSEEQKASGIGRGPLESESFESQWPFVVATSKRNVLLCARQSGKTTGARLRHRRLLAEGKRCLYINLVRSNAKEQYFLPLLSELAEAGFDTSNVDMSYLILRAKNGGLIRAWSADDIRDVGKGRGFQWDEVFVDESQEYDDSVICPLLDNVIIPTLIKTGGSLTLGGTPPAAIRGYFVDAYNSGTWRRFGWSIFDNPHIPVDNVREAYEARGIGPGHPIWEREVLGKLVADPDALVYSYDAERNGASPADLFLLDDKQRPLIDRSVWRLVLGLDLGFRDCSAIVVVAYRRDDPERRLYVVHEWEQAELDVDALKAAFRQAVVTWRPGLVIGDHGGHATQMVLETLSAQFGRRIEKKPPDLIVSTQLLADDFRAGRLKASTSSMIARDAAMVIWSEGRNGKLEPNVKGFHSDVLDALRYAHWGARHWAAKAPKQEPPPPDRLQLREMNEKRLLKPQKRFPWSR